MANVSGGAKLEKALAEMAAKLRQKDTLRVGFLENATYPDGQSVAEVAFWMDMGTKTSPPRPFFRNVVAEKSKGWPKGLSAALKFTGMNVKRSLEITGLAIKEQVQQSIRDTNEPPLAESTIKAKGFDKPLIDTSVMLNSVDFDVKS